MILTSAEPQLYVADVSASCDFYTAKLGFEVAFVFGDPPFYGQVRRDEAKLNLRFVSEPIFAGDIRAREELLAASITVKSAKKLVRLFDELQTAGAPFHQGLKEQSWGALTFVVVDPDGNLILFAGPAE